MRISLSTKRFLMTITEEMYAHLEKEEKKRGLMGIQETLRQILSEYFATAG